MYKETFKKIQHKAAYLKRIHDNKELQNLELFDEPYKLAIKILDCDHLDDAEAAQYLEIHLSTVKQVRSALGE